MATNPPKGDGHRNGEVRSRSQRTNSLTGTPEKRNDNTGRFMSVKAGEAPYKGVRKEK